MKIPAATILSALSTLALAACAGTPSPQLADRAVPASVELQILAINDFHGNLEIPTGTTAYSAEGETVREVLGGAARLGATMEALRAGQAHSVSVAAGDLIGGTPFVSANFLDEPAIASLNLMKLDVAAVGNHEFDRGIAELRRIQNGGCEQNTLRTPCALEPFDGAAFTYLAGNTVDEAGQTLFPGGVIRAVGPARIGFVGLTLRATATLVAPSQTAGYRFLNEAETANRLARQLLDQGADTVVLLIHEGARVDPAQNISACPNLSGPVVPILEELIPEIGLVVSGHTHQSYICHLPRPGAGMEASARVLTSAGRYGSFVTDIRLSFDPVSRAVAFATARNVPVNGAAGENAVIDQLVARYSAAAAPMAARVVGTLTPPADSDARTPEACIEPVEANLVADAQLHAARQRTGGRADMAFMNISGVRTRFPNGYDPQITYGQIFAMQPFGNTLQVLEMSGADLYNVLEEQFCGDGLARPCFGLLAPSANIRIRFDRSRPPGQRVLEIEHEGRGIDRQASYRVAVNNFLASGGDGFATFSRQPTRADAGLDLDALENWLMSGDRQMPACGRLADLTPPQV
ncbi:bifunctional metallophosphatase/5'-nucleotidase [Alteraurantiacibacter palmitatis]|uniref:Bifunctional metallophosphatase/5'-nucleotidase n=2 Tax=Alteraurantiacibacter palmitatis TaxID=2054628 RepID=A0ABV7EC78_9SPHN